MRDGAYPITLQFSRTTRFTDKQFCDFCQQNNELRIERTADGDIEIAPPVDGTTGYQNAILNTFVYNWTKMDGMVSHLVHQQALHFPTTRCVPPTCLGFNENVLPNSPQSRRKNFYLFAQIS